MYSKKQLFFFYFKSQVASLINVHFVIAKTFSEESLIFNIFFFCTLEIHDMYVILADDTMSLISMKLVAIRNSIEKKIKKNFNPKSSTVMHHP